MASFVFVPWSRNGVSGCGFFSISIRFLVALANLSSDEVFGIWTCLRNNATVSVVFSPLVAGMYTL